MLDPGTEAYLDALDAAVDSLDRSRVLHFAGTGVDCITGRDVAVQRAYAALGEPEPSVAGRPVRITRRGVSI